ncbi:MAG: helix-turn-helix transcriptional regulator [Succinivibrio sp.]
MSDESRSIVNLLPLSYGLGLIKELVPVPTHVFKSDYHYFEKFDYEGNDDWNVLKTDFQFRKRILDEISQKGVAIISEERPVLYGGVCCADGLTLVVGPIVVTEVDNNFCRLYALKHQATNVSLFHTDVQKLSSILLLVYSTLSQKYISLNDFLEENYLNKELIESTNRQIARIISNQTITNRPHNPGIFEASIRMAIRNGDEEELKKALNSIYANMRGTLSKNELRSAKNLAIVDITIATRAAIDAGLSVEELYVISDGFIMEVEECRFPEEALGLARACALRCTSMVAKFLRNKKQGKELSPMVSRACDYLDRHIYEKFDIDVLCSKLKVSPSYLSKMFRQEKRMTLGEYSRLRKIETAKIILSSYDKSIYEIALMFSFNSQSHFGRVFLELTGKTPAQYRKENAIRDSVF